MSSPKKRKMGDRRILTDGETEYTARSYQEELEDISLRKNTIIHLPTGSGKTFIAIRLIKSFKEALRKPWGAGGKRTFFLVNTVPLVVQQKRQIEKLCPVTVGAYSGEDGVDYWDKAKSDAELTRNQVVVMTSQILADMLTHSYIKIEDLNLIIFDECHHAVDNHPMRLIMKHFESCPPHKQPRVLGLTATLLNSNVSKVMVEVALRDLEKTFHATIATVNELGEVLNYSTNPHELVLFYQSAQPTSATREVVVLLTKLQTLIMKYKLPQPTNHDVILKKWQQDITTDPNKIVKNVKNMVVSMVLLLEELGAYGGAIAIVAYIILLERLKRKASTKEEETLYKFTITHSLEARMILLDSMKEDKGYAKIVKHSSEKIILLLNTLKEYSPNAVNKSGVLMKVNLSRQPLSAIIFTQQRFTAKVLYNLLKDVKEANPKEFDFLKHDFIVGFNVNPFKCTREQHYTKKASQTALLEFANRNLNCLISTSVIEEGVDIPQCLLVLKFDQPLEYRSYIQSKGRARSSESSYVMLINRENQSKFMKQFQVFQQTERIIQNILIGKSDDRDAPSMDEIQEGLYDEDEIPPYITEHGGRLSAISAISLLGRYCSLLPHDQFTSISPMWIQEKVVDSKNVPKRLVTVIMPIACPVKEEILGLPFASTKSAKRSAALNACIRLHLAGELDPVTLLPKPYTVVNFDSEEVKVCFPNWPWEGEPELEGVPKTGGKKRMRKHDIVFPSFLKGKPINQPFYLHIIKLKTKFARPTESREKALYDFFQRDECFGVLTHNRLPSLCSFPMFVKSGEVETSLEVNYAVIQLDSKLFELVKQFHLFIFDQVLAVAKKFLIFDGEDNCMYVVPINSSDNGFDIDWDIMVEHKNIRPVAVPTNQERKSIKVTNESYKDCVVSPWYRGLLLPDRYIVTKVLEYKTPNSLFEDASYDTFSDYYSDKYNLRILGPQDQSLLEVKNITTGMNCLLPRAATIKEFTDKQLKLVCAAQGDDKTKNFDEIFIPEFCIKYEFPGVLWYKAMILPGILHRIVMLLGAQELLMAIAKDTKYGKPILAKTEEWAPITVDKKQIIKTMLSQVEEPMPIARIDRINNSIHEDALETSNVSMADSFYQLQKKKIQAEYPWDEKMEPIDIERNLSTVTVMDIECYDKFVSAPMVESAPLSPPAAGNMAAAIRAPPNKCNDKIKLLQLKPTGRGPELKDVVAALTTIKSHDSFDLERAETLGDSFLKFAATLYLYHKFPKLNEGQLTNIKCRLISNRNLYYAGERINVGGRMKVEPFIPRKDILVPGFFAPRKVREFIEENKIRPTFLISMQLSEDEVLSGKLSPKSWKQVTQRYSERNGVEVEPEGAAQNAMQCYVKKIAVSDKSVADCVEALVGTYLFSGGILGAVKFVEWMRILPPQDNFAQILNKPRPESTLLSEHRPPMKDIDFLLNNCRIDVEEILGYKFKDPLLLLEALSHASYIKNRVTRSYERLEFLGDAILDFLITSNIYENCQDIKPGEMTDLRSALVNNVTFAAYVVKLGLHKFICSKLNPNLDKAIISFVEHQELRRHEILEDVLYLIDEEDCQVAQYIDVPKVLSDIFESLAGAIYLDSLGDLQAVWSVFYRIMNKEIQDFAENVPKNPVRLLYEDIHACPKFGKAKFFDVDETKIVIEVSFTKKERVYSVQGVGNNKAQAKRAAAKCALKVLQL